VTPEITSAFDRLKREYGPRSLDRVEQMLDPERQHRHPLQKGARWILPGITQRPWHDPFEYAEVATVVRAFEANHAQIRRELESAWAERGDRFSAYEHYLTRHPDWRALYLFRGGRTVSDAATVMPTAAKVLQDVAIGPGKLCPLLECHFSTLLPGAAIAPHCDLWNFSINLHFAIDIPPGCGIRVAGETRTWVEGECLLFDYSFEHEAWNRGARPRTCLLVDLWHPETTIAERAALVVLITEIRKLLDED
jgi:hypothetical protein